ncbi:MAG: Histidinol dehydrogenase [Candidatus Carbobacillus altaicus]|uniref:Histidinol dehydrogenase n=1 Tax=Candidatus Carbonibacillus altaicus TaxID=2163959 RepID=A0A2R6XYM6_9BACL|nr:MAG: Histidinol dehydrogenase [Candidatus Carbobacillus altaicus]
MRRVENDITEDMRYVQPIVDAVREKGDEALLTYTERFDGVRMAREQLYLTPEVVRKRALSIAARRPDLDRAVALAQEHIERYHRAQLPPPFWSMAVSPGVYAGEKTTPIDSVALYVPRGKGSFPSVYLMLAVPAKVAGVPHPIVLTPPNANGDMDEALYLAAWRSGIEDVYLVGGAQGVAAVAYGTETVPNMQKIIGPGNRYVTAAKRLLSQVIDPGPFAGPSEAILIADETARPEWVAHDLLVEAEHGPDSSVIFLTYAEDVFEAVGTFLPELIDRLPEPRQSFVKSVFETYGALVLTESLEDAVAWSNAYAPEHLQLHVRDPWRLLPKLKHAGEILLGATTPIPLGNFMIGTNAILPTGGHARTRSSLSVHDFLKRTSVAWTDIEGYEQLRPYARLLAEEEGFPAHARALDLDRRG